MRKEVYPTASELRLSMPDLLLSLHCAEKRGDAVIPTLAGLLLFGTDSVLRRYFSLMRIDYLRTKTRQRSNDMSDDLYYSLEFRESLFTMLPKVEAAIMANIEREISVPSDKLTREERPIVPHKAIREALVNAVMHRDYHENGPTTIIQYPDRIEFFNHGYSLKPIETYGEYGKSKTRNQSIAAVLHETEYAENKGTGIPKIRGYLKTAHLEEPIFLSDKESNTFSVTFYFHQLIDDKAKEWLANFKSLSLSSEETRILVYTHKNISISNEEGRAITGLDTIHVSKLLTDLRKKGALEQHSGGPNTYYTISSVFVQNQESPDATNNLGLDPKITPLDPKITPLDPKITPLDPKIESSREQRIMLLNHLPINLRSEILGLKQRITPEKAEDLIYKVCQQRAFSAAEIAIIFDKNKWWPKDHIGNLILQKKLSLTIPDKLTNKNQSYYANPDEPGQIKLDTF